MEVDYCARDEHKETSGGALFPVGEPTGGSLSDRPMRIDQGQWAIAGRCQTLSKLRPALIDAPVCALSLYAGAPESSEECSARRDAAGRQLCERCGRQPAKVKHTHPHGVGRACHPRCKPQKGGVDAAATPTGLPPRSHKRYRDWLKRAVPSSHLPLLHLLLWCPLPSTTATPGWNRDGR